MTLQNIQHKCSHCDKPAKVYYPKNRPSPRYYKTCGSKKCAFPNINERGLKGRLMQNGKKKICEKCHNEYNSNSPRQMFCKTCSPNVKFRGAMRRYRLSAPEYQSMLIIHDGKCFICREREATCIDHDHETRKVRGLLCDYCNLGLGYIDKEQWHDKAIKYLKVYK